MLSCFREYVCCLWSKRFQRMWLGINIIPVYYYKFLALICITCMDLVLMYTFMWPTLFVSLGNQDQDCFHTDVSSSCRKISINSNKINKYAKNVHSLLFLFSQWIGSCTLNTSSVVPRNFKRNVQLIIKIYWK